MQASPPLALQLACVRHLPGADVQLRQSAVVLEALLAGGSATGEPATDDLALRVTREIWWPVTTRYTVQQIEAALLAARP